MSVLLEPIAPQGRFKGDVPLSLAIKAGNLVFVSGIPGFAADGSLARGDFPTQMVQVMENIGAILESSGAGWDRVVRTRVYLLRQSDFFEMNRIYSTYFRDGRFPARTTLCVAALPRPDFLLEIECEAVLA